MRPEGTGGHRGTALLCPNVCARWRCVATLPPGRGKADPSASPERLYSTQSCMNVELKELSAAGEGGIVLSCYATAQLRAASACSYTSCTACKCQTNYTSTLLSGLQFHRITMESK